LRISVTCGNPQVRILGAVEAGVKRESLRFLGPGSTVALVTWGGMLALLVVADDSDAGTALQGGSIVIRNK
jgi:hypothetical protein